MKIVRNNTERRELELNGQQFNKERNNQTLFPTNYDQMTVA